MYLDAKGKEKLFNT